MLDHLIGNAIRTTDRSKRIVVRIYIQSILQQIHIFRLDIPTNYTCMYLSTLVTSYRDVVDSFDVLIYYICVLNKTKLIFDAR